MATVTGRIKEIKQPRGGYINPKQFEKVELDCDVDLHENENIHVSLIGLVVDYLTRYSLEKDVEKAFEISLIGAYNAKELEKANFLLSCVNGLDDESIKSACKLVGYDVCYRVGTAFFNGVDHIEPDSDTIYNIRQMVKRSLLFVENYGPITQYGFDLEGSYTKLINKGDGDFLTKDCLWDFKVTKSKITSKITLQILIYYLMGKKSIHDYFNHITKIGIFNPRLNHVYLLNISEIDDNVISTVASEVIGY